MFASFKKELEVLLPSLVSDEERHAKWLNTLSFLENCGARKIASCEHPTKVKKEMLKHAAEEFRHAFYLKDQIKRISALPLSDYGLDAMLGGMATLHYLGRLDLETTRLLKTRGTDRSAAYILVTYAIERRADELYPLYMTVLKEQGSPITVKSILLEEEEHLKEMEAELAFIPQGQSLANDVLAIEGALCKQWLALLHQEARCHC